MSKQIASREVRRPSEGAAAIHPSRLGVCFGGRVSETLLTAIHASPRLATRLTQMAEAHYGPIEPIDRTSIGEADLAIISLSAEGITSIALRAGAIYWSGAIASTVLATKVAALNSELSEELCSYAVSHRHLSSTEHELPAINALRQRIDMDGWQCLSAWSETLPANVAARLRLNLPPHPIFDAPPSDKYRDIGPAIVRHAALNE